MPTRQTNIAEIVNDIHTIKHSFIASHAKNALKHIKKIKHPNITPSQWVVLNIVMAKTAVSAKTIAKILGITGSATTQLINELVNKGYLIRQNCLTDRRSIIIKISKKQQQKLTKLKTQALQNFTTIFKTLSDQELAVYAKLNKKIATGITSSKQAPLCLN